MDYSLLRQQIIDNCKFLFPDRPLALVCGKDLTKTARSPATDYMRVIDTSPESAFQLDSGLLAEGRSSKGPGTALVLLFHQTQAMVQEQLDRRREESALLAGSVKARLQEAEGETDVVLKELEKRFSKRAQLIAEAWKLKDMAKVRDIVDEFEHKLLAVAKTNLAAEERDSEQVYSEEEAHNLLPRWDELGGGEQRLAETLRLEATDKQKETTLQEAGCTLAGQGAVLVLARNLVIADESSLDNTNPARHISRIYCSACADDSANNKKLTVNVEEISIASTEPNSDPLQHDVDTSLAEANFTASMDMMVHPGNASSEPYNLDLSGADTPLLERDTEDGASIRTTYVTNEYEIINSADLPSPDSPELALIEKQFARRMARRHVAWNIIHVITSPENILKPFVRFDRRHRTNDCRFTCL